MGSCRVDRVSGGGVKNIKKKTEGKEKTFLIILGFLKK